MRRGWVVMLLLPALAGCLSGADEDPRPTEDPDPRFTLQGILLDAADDAPIQGGTVILSATAEVMQVTDAEGSFRFNGIRPGPCSLEISADGYAAGIIDLSCDRDRHVNIRLERELSFGNARPPSVEESPLVPGGDDEVTFTLYGTVTAGGGPVPGATVTLVGDKQVSDVTDGDGRYMFVVAPAIYTLSVEAACAVDVEEDVRVEAETRHDIHLAESDRRPPGAPTALAGLAGPGPAQATISWQPPQDHGGAPVERYVIQRDGQEFTTVGNTLAFGDTGASPGGHTYAVAATNGCGSQGPFTPPVQATPLPGVLLDAPVSAATGIEGTLRTYPVLDADGQPAGNRTWRTLTGLGNCCETYVASSADGRLFEYGGSVLRYSDDEGVTWSQVSNVLPALGAEGAIVGAPGGDMLAVNWDPYTGDLLWSHKYVAATGDWYTARTPLHQPFFDRPWVAVIEGPFKVEGLVVPYVSFLMSNYVHGDVLLMSLDGLHYQAPTARLLTAEDQPIPTKLPPDPDRDWIQSIRETSVYPVDGGFGLRARSTLSTCPVATLSPDLVWRCADWPGMTRAPDRDEVLRVDSAGRFHIFTLESGADRFAYRVSSDGGATWAEGTFHVPLDLVIEDWDVQVNAALDQAVLVVHASESTAASTIDQDMVFRFTGLGKGPHLEEILLVGLGDHPFGGGLGSAYDRFDYTTVALLPSGHVALSFGDSVHTPPGVAVEAA